MTDSLVVEHVGIARGIAADMAARYPGADRADILSDAYMGLWRAARTWDPEVGVTFVGYARKLVKWDVLEGIRSRLGRRPPQWTGFRRGRSPVRAHWCVPLSDFEGHDPGAEDPGYEQVLSRVDLAATIRDLSPNERERTVLAVVATGATLREAGAAIGVSESRACQILGTIRRRLD